MVKTGNESETTPANTPNNIEIDHCWIEATQAGTVRGVFVNGRNINIHDNYISGFRNSGHECQAILLAGGPGPVMIDNNVSPTVAKRNLDRTKLIKMMTEGASPTVNAAADHVSFDSDGQTINWTTADGTARQIIVLWIG